MAVKARFSRAGFKVLVSLDWVVGTTEVPSFHEIKELAQGEGEISRSEI
jgi:hypothetical protein